VAITLVKLLEKSLDIDYDSLEKLPPRPIGRSFWRSFMSTKICPLAAVAMLAQLGVANAQSVRIDLYLPASPSPISSFSVASGSPINVNADRDIARICIYTEDGGWAANVGRVNIHHSGPFPRTEDLHVLLMNHPANLPIPPASEELPVIANDWGGIEFDASTLGWANISASISGDLTGPVATARLTRVQLQGELSAAITAIADGAGAIGVVHLGCSSPFGTITASAGAIGRISASGNLFASVIAEGDIQQIDVAGSVFSDAGALHILSRNGSIGCLVVGGIIGPSDGFITDDNSSIDAGISIGDVRCSGMSSVKLGSSEVALGHVWIGGDLFPATSNPFDSVTIECATLGSLTVTGDVRGIFGFIPPFGTITYVTRIVAGTLAEASSIRIGGRFPSRASIHLSGAPTPLSGQIVLNGNASIANPDQLWGGSIEVAGQVESLRFGPNEAYPDTSPHYERAASQLGGGAIGLVPFARCRADDHPQSLAASPSGEVAEFPLASEFNSATSGVQVAFYGPVAFENDGTGIQLFRINPSTGRSLLTPESNFNTSVTRGRILQITGTADEARVLAPGTYEARINTTGSNRLLCRDITPLTAVLAPSSHVPYQFYIRGDCSSGCPCDTTLCFLADWDLDDDVDSDDVVGFWTDFEAGASDCDRDGDTDSDDVLLFYCIWDMGGC